MPSSRPELIQPVIVFMSRANPETFLDVGCGFGKFGFLAREYLGLWNARDGKRHKLKTVDAIEIYPNYIGPLQRQIYDKIIIGDIRKLCKGIDNYDLILMAEVIEHIEKDEGIHVLETLRDKSKNLMVTTPLEVKEQKAEFGNEHERHLSQWSKKDFAKLGCKEIFESEELGHFVVMWG